MGLPPPHLLCPQASCFTPWTAKPQLHLLSTAAPSPSRAISSGSVSPCPSQCLLLRLLSPSLPGLPDHPYLSKLSFTLAALFPGGAERPFEPMVKGTHSRALSILRYLVPEQRAPGRTGAGNQRESNHLSCASSMLGAMRTRSLSILTPVQR